MKSPHSPPPKKEMKGLVKKLNIILNIGGIFTSLFGIICVLKIAFAKPWEIEDLRSEFSFGKVEEKQSAGSTHPELERSDEIPVALNPTDENADSTPKKGWMERVFAKDQAKQQPDQTTQPTPVAITETPRGTRTFAARLFYCIYRSANNATRCRAAYHRPRTRITYARDGSSRAA